MSTQYISDVLYEDLVKLNVEGLLIFQPSPSIYIFPHKGLRYNGNNIIVFKGDGTEDCPSNMAIFERRGLNNPSEILNLILALFPGCKIVESCSGISWPRCGI